jgi:hypothetical protein
MRRSRRAVTGASMVGLSALALLVGGCSADDVEFNGKLFELAGLTSKSRSAEPKMAQRAPLVLPPNLERLPEPGKPPEAAGSDVAALNDPDKAAHVSKEELARQQAEYCKVHYEDAKAHGREVEADTAQGPLGSCRGSVLTAIQGWTKNDNDDDQ